MNEFRVLEFGDLEMDDFDLGDRKFSIDQQKARERFGYSPAFRFPDSTILNLEGTEYHISWGGDLSFKGFNGGGFTLPIVGTSISNLGSDPSGKVGVNGIAIKEWQTLVVNTSSKEYSTVNADDFYSLPLRGYRILGYLNGDIGEFITSCGRSIGEVYSKLERGWANFDPKKYNIFSAYRENSRVYLSGNIYRTSITSGISFILPLSLRPKKSVIVILPSSLGSSTLEISTTGESLLTSERFPKWFSLDGLSFKI